MSGGTVSPPVLGTFLAMQLYLTLLETHTWGVRVSFDELRLSDVTPP